MPGLLANHGASVMCAHGGQAKPTAPNPRVKVGGEATVPLSAPYTISGCPLPPIAGGPCVTGQWVAGTVRVTSGGQPLVIQGGTAVCTPTGVPLMITVAQMRVRAS